MPNVPNTPPPAGWFPDPRNARQQRWWNGMAWTEHSQPVPVPRPAPVPQPARPQAPAAWTPSPPTARQVWRTPTTPALKSPRKWYRKKRVIIPASLLALVPVSLLALVIIAIATSGGNGSTQAAVPARVTSSVTTTPAAQATTSAPATTAPPAPTTKAPEAPKTTAPAPAPAPKTTAPASMQYSAISARDFKLLAKDPDAYAGKGYVVYGTVTQFDAATGNRGFLASTGPAKVAASDWYLLEQNTALTGDAAMLAPIVEGDLFEAQVVVVGSYSYDTQIGGNTTVPEFKVITISVYGSAE